MKTKSFLFLIIGGLVLVILSLGVSVLGYGGISQMAKSVWNKVASVFFVYSVTVSGLEQKYQDALSGTMPGATNNPKVKILIMPGHEPNYGGAEFGGLKERDMNVDLANDLVQLLKTDPRYGVVVGRDKQEWNPDLQNILLTIGAR